LDGFTEDEKARFDAGQLVVRFADSVGKNSCGAYHPVRYVKECFSHAFDILEVIESRERGNQYVYLMRKPSVAPSVDEVRQEDDAIFVSGRDFTKRSVVNFFCRSAGEVINIGGLEADGPRIPVKVLSPTMLSFTPPTDAPAGEAYVQVVNPPFNAALNSGSGPGGSLVLKPFDRDSLGSVL
jgi:hypothetical protein